MTSRRRFGDWLLAQLEADGPAVLVPVHSDVYAAPDLSECVSSWSS